MYTSFSFENLEIKERWLIMRFIIFSNEESHCCLAAAPVILCHELICIYRIV